MMNENYVIDDLLVKYLLQETTGEEQAAVEQWIAESDANKKHFDQLKQIWDASEHLIVRSAVREEDAWSRLQQRINHETAARVKTRSWKQAPLRIAAGIVLLLGVALFYSLWNRSQELITLASNEAVVTDTLSDGTVVTLNKQAVLKYPEKFSGDQRLVVLDGEAFFDVAPDTKRPFVIEANQSRVKVVGTSFNVNSSASKTEVIVTTGVVEVSKDDSKVVLHPNEKALVSYDRATILKQMNEDQLYNYYYSKEFVCNGTPLYKLVDVLSQAYGKDIVIANKNLADLPLTATFRNESLEDVLAVISETFNIAVIKKEGKIILR